MVHYKLVYFPLRGRGDAIRQLFKIAGIKYEQQDVTMEQWPQLKGKMPLGQLPVLEVDGQQIGQSVAILRFLGHQFNRAGRNAVECARLDMIADHVQDMSNAPGFGQWGGVLLGFIPADKDVYFKEKVMPDVEKFAPVVEKFLLENGNNLLIGDTETWVDIFVAEMFSKVEDYGEKGALSAFPHIQQLISRIHNIPAIQRHIQERGPVPF